MGMKKDFIVRRSITMVEGKPHVETYSEQELVRCKDCKYLIDHYGFMNDGYCANMRDEYCVKFKPDKDWFCADGERRESE
jgi:hypothetical protein